MATPLLYVSIIIVDAIGTADMVGADSDATKALSI